jgi:four helix bundle protein
MAVERTPSKCFMDLLVWQKAHRLVLDIYRYSDGFPRKEIYGLTSQFRRAAVSVPANIAEGYKRRTRQEKIRFLNIAQGSLEECRYYLILSNDLGYGDTVTLLDMMEEVSRLLDAYIKAIAESC